MPTDARASGAPAPLRPNQRRAAHQSAGRPPSAPILSAGRPSRPKIAPGAHYWPRPAAPNMYYRNRPECVGQTPTWAESAGANTQKVRPSGATARPGVVRAHQKGLRRIHLAVRRRQLGRATGQPSLAPSAPPGRPRARTRARIASCTARKTQLYSARPGTQRTSPTIGFS